VRKDVVGFFRKKGGGIPQRGRSGRPIRKKRWGEGGAGREAKRWGADVRDIPLGEGGAKGAYVRRRNTKQIRREGGKKMKGGSS